MPFHALTYRCEGVGGRIYPRYYKGNRRHFGLLEAFEMNGLLEAFEMNALLEAFGMNAGMAAEPEMTRN